MLNTDKFVVLAGNPEAWDNETMATCRPGIYANTYNSADLCKLQISQHSRGRREATLFETIYGWSVRHASNLSSPAVLRSGRDNATKADAIAWGIAWANADPDYREFYVSKRDV